MKPKQQFPGMGGAVPSRPDNKMGAEHPRSIGPWRGVWSWSMQHVAKKKRRQRDRKVIEEQLWD